MQARAPSPASLLERTRYRRRTPETTVLQQTICEHVATFLASADARAEADPGRSPLPNYVRREFDNFIDCGILARGFVRAYCDACRQSILIAYSCKARAVCPSCTSRRMAEVAAHLTDHVLPEEAPIRQWVLSLPHRVRYLLARKPDLCREVRGIFVRAVQSFYVRRARDQGIAGGRCGAVVCTQRSDTALRLDVHFHALVIDGVYTGFGLGESVVFQPATFLRDEEVESLARHVRVLIDGHLRRNGYLDDDSEFEPDEQQLHHAAAATGSIPLGPRAGQRATLFGDESDPRPSIRPKKKLCADVAGYSLHAAVRCGAGQTSRLERLCRYVARPPFAQDRLSVASDGSIVYRRATADPRTHHEPTAA